MNASSILLVRTVLLVKTRSLIMSASVLKGGLVETALLTSMSASWGSVRMVQPARTQMVPTRAAVSPDTRTATVQRILTTVKVSRVNTTPRVMIW